MRDGGNIGQERGAAGICADVWQARQVCGREVTANRGQVSGSGAVVWKVEAVCGACGARENETRPTSGAVRGSSEVGREAGARQVNGQVVAVEKPGAVEGEPREQSWYVCLQRNGGGTNTW